MWNAFNNNASWQLNDMYMECKKNMKPVVWMGESFWHESQECWETKQYETYLILTKSNRKSSVSGVVAVSICVFTKTRLNG